MGSVGRSPSAEDGAGAGGGGEAGPDNAPDPTDRIPEELEKILRRREGYQYLLVQLDWPACSNKALGIVLSTRLHRVIVADLKAGSLGAEKLKVLDHVVAIDGVPVSDKDVAKSLILKNKGKFAALVERATNDKAAAEFQSHSRPIPLSAATSGAKASAPSSPTSTPTPSDPALPAQPPPPEKVSVPEAAPPPAPEAKSPDAPAAKVEEAAAKAEAKAEAKDSAKTEAKAEAKAEAKPAEVAEAAAAPPAPAPRKRPKRPAWPTPPMPADVVGIAEKQLAERAAGPANPKASILKTQEVKEAAKETTKETTKEEKAASLDIRSESTEYLIPYTPSGRKLRSLPPSNNLIKPAPEQ